MKLAAAGLVSVLLLAACGGGASLGPASGCDGSCADIPVRLEIADVERILAQAIAEAGARSALATIAVTDRVGNVLGVFQMTGADTTLTTDGGRGVSGGLDNISIIPSTLGAISKAITAAYLSSEGNAFTSRTAGQIVQLHFYPGELGQPGGPLFGVQFSSLPCSDLSTRFVAARPSTGPHRAPLGLAADPGGIPLYKNGTPVGAIGVIADGIYGIDRDIRNRDIEDDEVIALAGSFGFEAPVDRRADRITVDGKPLRFIDALPGDLKSNPATAPVFVDGVGGSLVTVPGYMSSSVIIAGTAFGQPESGVRAGAGAFTALNGYVLVDGSDVERYPPRAGTDAADIGAGNILSAAEVQQLLVNALGVANRTRAQIRRPLGTPARVSISVVDTYGAVLGLVRSKDAPVFGIDVSLQKARSAAFFSNAAAAADLLATPDTQYQGSGATASIADYVQSLRDFIGQPSALADGVVAYSDRAIGNLARPYFPDGLVGSPNGPLSKPVAEWSPFSTGLQLDLVNSAVLQHVVFVLGGGGDVAAGDCTGMPVTAGGATRLPNGIQIFPGSVPIYRGGTLVGAIGISGDGIDQDDMVAFLGLHEAGLTLGTLGQAPAAMRADTLEPQGVRLRYVQCPQSPYYASDAQNVCENK